MAYTKQNFQGGDVLYASQLNSMDDEIDTLTVKDQTKGKVIIPIYIGDYISDCASPNSAVKVGNYFYTFNAPGNSDGTNLGTVRKFDVKNNCEVIESPISDNTDDPVNTDPNTNDDPDTNDDTNNNDDPNNTDNTNTNDNSGNNDIDIYDEDPIDPNTGNMDDYDNDETGDNTDPNDSGDDTGNDDPVEEECETSGWPRKILMGHANSATYDGTYIYVSPLWDLTVSSSTMANYVYVYDSEMNYVGKLDCPFAPMGITYDWKAKILYVMRIAGIYKRVDDQWVYVGKIQASDNPGWSLNQDFAIYDGHFYWSDPTGNIIYGKLKSGTQGYLGSYVLHQMDSLCRFYMGELEGMDFDSAGHLYALCRIGVTSNVKDCFIMEIPVGETLQNTSRMGGAIYHMHDGTVTLSEETQRKFALGTNEIRSIMQMDVRLMPHINSAIKIPEGSVVYDNFKYDRVRIDTSISIWISGVYVCKGIDILNGNVSFMPQNDTHYIECTDSYCPFTLKRAAMLSFNDKHQLNIYAPNATSSLLLDIGATSPLVICRRVPRRPQSVDPSPNTFSTWSIGNSSGTVAMTNNGYYIGGFVVSTQITQLSRGYRANDYVPVETFFFRPRQIQTGILFVTLQFEVAVNLPTDGTMVRIATTNGITGPYGWSHEPFVDCVLTSEDGNGVCVVRFNGKDLMVRAYGPSIGKYHLQTSFLLG